jgi:3-dehydroquinate synthase
VSLTIRSNIHDYTVNEQPDLTAAIRSLAAGRNVFAIADKALLDLPAHRAAFESLPADRLIAVEATESQKSIENVPWICTRLLEGGFRRDCELLAIGGGVVQDTACFIASVLLRGVKWSFIPTTLLAQCDSCIGSKSSINIGRFKNQIGNFYPPHEIALATSVLSTLPPDEIRSGMGEAIKLHLLSSEADAAEIGRLMARYATDATALGEIIWSSLRIKQRYIEVDEFDKGVRNILNYGHTFGHAYESVTGYAIPHGIAVSLGIATATFVSERMGLAPAGHAAAVDALLRPWYEPYQHEIGRLEAGHVLAAMKLDKKNTSTTMNCILTAGYGKMEKKPVDPARLQPLLVDFLGSKAA